jgi:protein FrlC
MRRLAPSQLIGANFSFRHYPFDKVAKLLSDLGMQEIELRGAVPSSRISTGHR